jgi:hypothetical protein
MGGDHRNLRAPASTVAAQGSRRSCAGTQTRGVFILEAYTPAQLPLGTGGPKAAELLMSLAGLREELAGLELLIAREIEREVVEGSCHTGRGTVVQILARRGV